jgi:hypothetical protein
LRHHEICRFSRFFIDVRETNRSLPPPAIFLVIARCRIARGAMSGTQRSPNHNPFFCLHFPAFRRQFMLFVPEPAKNSSFPSFPFVQIRVHPPTPLASVERQLKITMLKISGR